MVWLPISEFTQAHFESGRTFMVFSQHLVEELVPAGVTVGYPFDTGSGFSWEIAMVDSEGEFMHVSVEPGSVEYPTHFAVVVPPPGAVEFDYRNPGF